MVTACLQGTLLIMAVYFEYFGPKMKESHRHGEETVPDGSVDDEREDVSPDQHHRRQATEETPLLESE